MSIGMGLVLYVCLNGVKRGWAIGREGKKKLGDMP